jgi:hypothetical protein
MGSGRWSTNVYDERKRSKAAAGESTFDYSDKMHRRDRNKWKIHETLNPHGKIRECRDSAEHPNSTAISVMFDVTGSMRTVPQVLQQKLPDLLGLLIRKGYVTDPQILFGAIGDATCDRIPLQVGQFESDNRMDENLENIFLEGGGGGQRRESYELAMYYFARQTDIDCWNKRRKKGYLFIIGDEMSYPRVSRRHIVEHIAPGARSDASTKEIVDELRERYHVFYILPKAAGYGGDETVLNHWRGLLGEHVLELDDSAAVCETIALTIGMFEGTIDLMTGRDDLRDAGIPATTLNVVTQALAHVPVGMVKSEVSGGVLQGLS